MKSKTKTYVVEMVRTNTKSKINFPVEVADAFKAVKAAEDQLEGWTPVKVKPIRNKADLKKLQEIEIEVEQVNDNESEE